MNIILIIVIIIGVVLFINFNNNSENFKFELDKENKMKLYDECKFYAHGTGKDNAWEQGECSIAIQIVPYAKNVLELGGGTGKVSHIINKKLQERGLEYNHIVVEPSIGFMGFWFGSRSLKKNKKKFNDQYTIVRKYAENLTREDLKNLNGPPDMLYSDCEGCLYKFFNTEIGKYVLNNVRFVINEMDGNNENIIKELTKRGFTKIGTGYGCGGSCDTEVWYR